MVSDTRMLFFAFWLVSGVAVLAVLLMLVDALPRARAALRRRRSAREGIFGVVIDRDGEVIGVYRDPFAPPTRTARLLDRDSPWTQPHRYDDPGWAWEGLGATEEEARNAAYRQRRLYLLLHPELDRGDHGDHRDHGEPGPPFG